MATNTDLTEEDAADLQFPKDNFNPAPIPYFSNKLIDDSDITGDYCANCDSELGPKYIQCPQCNVNLCCLCFSKGVEFSNHKSNHDYKVLHTNFILYDNSDWTAEEELKLLEGLNSYGNWNLVAQDLPNRSVKEIIEHYEQFYLDGGVLLDIPRFPELDAAAFPPTIVPYQFKLTDCDDPPRYSSSSTFYANLAGYNAARSEFESEYDANAEDILSNLEVLDESHPFYKITNSLQFQLIESYNKRLKERQRWKDVMRAHGLISIRKTVTWLRRYDLTITKPIYEKLIKFMQFCDPTSFEYLMEGLHRAGELKIQISRLIQLRRKGVATLAGGKLFLRIQQIHEENRKKLKIFRSNSQFNWKAIRSNSTTLVIPKLNKRRQGFSPLDIVGLPGYEKLTDKERDLCSKIRLVPATYLELKSVLVCENNKVGHVKLQTARKLLKIDVNKTRRLFDFLVEEGFILK
ncbi:unnamed protein product [Brassicogethes aeneus]|uniref:Transcriptional adapter n=1 Tax=Brassicogethes aeneus TaxID=1431903 RepID=A0A9P0FJ75_BRAAE|nr:unnamed protein product [Brassicogethes aeneus]